MPLAVSIELPPPIATSPSQRAVLGGACVDQLNARIRPNLVVRDGVEPGGAKGLQRLLQQPGFHDPLVGDNQRPLDAQVGGLLPQ